VPGESLVRYALDAEPGESPLPRADLYRTLTRNVQREVLEVAFPKTRAVLGKDGLVAMMGAFLDDGGPQTLQYPCVPDDLVRWAKASSHRYADLLDYERASVRAERHLAHIDSLRPPTGTERLALNPTLEVCVCTRAVHEISVENPDPPTAASPFVYLVWRRPETDQIAQQRVGVAVGRCLGLLGIEPLTRARWIERSLSQELELDASVLRKVLLEACDDLVARSGIVAAFEDRL